MGSGLWQERWPKPEARSPKPKARPRRHNDGMRGGFLLIVILCTAVQAAAQQVQDPPAPLDAPAPETAVDATKLGVSLDRIQKGLRVTPSIDTQSGTALRLNFQVQVYGTAPRLEFFKDFDPVNGPDRYGAPSHRQMLDYWTPEEFKSPVMPISAIAAVAAKYIWGAARKASCEEELRQYRELVMQGVSIAAPRCTQ